MIHRVGTVDSTQRVAREMAAAGALHGTAVMAEAQTDGRGRLGRAWCSEAGENLLLSVVLRPVGPIADAPLLSLGAAAGLAIRFDLRVRWPNDLVSRDGIKVGGLLAELETTGQRVKHLILGLGLNVNQTVFPRGIEATSLAMLGGSRLVVTEVAEAAVASILAWSAHPDRLGQWRARAHTIGRRVRIGEREGIATGIREDGALLVDGEPVLTGDVELVRGMPTLPRSPRGPGSGASPTPASPAPPRKSGAESSS
ncbi:MAG: biotin--[acetyl-CoA-carboxylase] ligase [Myxococcales bacterium]|nr:biotin--[acetyl-CoA-carboxylase] ligase [Myxococcales bacterium]